MPLVTTIAKHTPADSDRSRTRVVGVTDRVSPTGPTSGAEMRGYECAGDAPIPKPVEAERDETDRRGVAGDPRRHHRAYQRRQLEAVAGHSRRDEESGQWRFIQDRHPVWRDIEGAGVPTVEPGVGQSRQPLRGSRKGEGSLVET